MIVQYVVFGEDASRRAAFGEWKGLKELFETSGDICKRKFKTEEERKAYLCGLDDMSGWLDCYPLDKDDVRKMQRHFKQTEINDLDKQFM